jgi:hypothetical protein
MEKRKEKSAEQIFSILTLLFVLMGGVKIANTVLLLLVLLILEAEECE